MAEAPTAMECFLPVAAGSAGLPTNMKRAPTLLDMDIAAEGPYHWIFRGAVGTVLGGDLVLGHGVRAAGGGTGNGVGTGIGSATIPTPLPVTRLPPPRPAARHPGSGGRQRGAGP